MVQLGLVPETRYTGEIRIEKTNSHPRQSFPMSSFRPTVSKSMTCRNIMKCQNNANLFCPWLCLIKPVMAPNGQYYKNYDGVITTSYTSKETTMNTRHRNPHSSVRRRYYAVVMFITQATGRTAKLNLFLPECTDAEHFVPASS